MAAIDVNAPIKIDYFDLKGGFDQMTPPLTVPPGRVLYAQNFEAASTGGYRRIAGYERFDGRPSPSAQYQYTLPATITGAWAVNDTITGAGSGATATVLGSTSEGFIVGKITGTFLASENLEIASTVVAVSTAAAHLGGADTAVEDAEYRASVADLYRADIAAVPGSGSVRGVWAYGTTVYAFRNNAGGTACVMHKSTASGWTAVSLGYKVAFNTGVGQISIGNTVVGATSGASAVVTGVAVRTGTWGTDATGLLTFASITGAFTSGEALQVASVTKATAISASAAISLSPGGRFQFVNTNFGGAAGTRKMYGCDGVNNAFEFDGTTFVPILTGMATDTPEFITAHKNHLFLAFGASLQHSGIGNPYAYSVVLGAGELALGDNITGLTPHVGSDQSAALIVLTETRVVALYGTSSADWQLIPNESEVGGLAYTQQKIGDMYWLDDRGVTSLKAVFQFGNFQQATITQQIQDWIIREKASAVDSCIVRNKNQYRLFFSDGWALYTTYMADGSAQIMPVYFNDAVTCSCSAEWTPGLERIFFGSSDGFVYEMDAGTSMDGAAIEAHFTTTYNHIRSPQVLKRYRKASLDIYGDGLVQFDFGYDLGYGDLEIAQQDSSAVETVRSAGLWDSFTWDRFFWDSRSYGPVQISINGSAENLALAVRSSSTAAQPFTITGMLVHYSPRRRVR